jgi:hypothetical protein
MIWNGCNFIKNFYFFNLIIFLLFSLLRKRCDSFHQLKCNSIYNQESLYTQFRIIPNFLTKKECKMIIDSSEKNKWTINRHSDYPTTDQEITSDWNFYYYLTNKIREKLFTPISDLFELKKDKLHIREIFISKYDATTENSQKSLEPHTDGCEFSFIIALNDNYLGGGTYFIKKKEKIRLNTGDVLIFCGQTRHEGCPVDSGIRYILPGFLYYGRCRQQDL